ncbi:unknown [Clostridium sp. CAG:921]|nr:unknown [Clostridium sp. CAG:921]
MKSKEIYNSENLKLYLRLIKRCYEKYEDYNIVDANIKTSLFKTM